MLRSKAVWTALLAVLVASLTGCSTKPKLLNPEEFGIEGSGEGEGEAVADGEGEAVADGEGEGEEPAVGGGEGPPVLTCEDKVFEDSQGVAMEEGAVCARQGECPPGRVECDPATGLLRCSTSAGGTDDQAGDEVCDGLDNDCDGDVDEGLGPIPTDELGGECADNVQVCDGAAGYQDSEDNYSPVDEVCDGLDNDCDGSVDVDCGCHVVQNINDTGLDLEFCTVVPAGGSATFWMGCREDLNGEDWACLPAERIRHRVTFEYGYELMRTEVTVEQYRACVDAGHPGCVAPEPTCPDGTSSNYHESGQDKRPIVCVSWAMSRAFSRWIGGRLPSESEWEYGARGPMASEEDYAVFPWGDGSIDCDHAAYSACAGEEIDVGSLSPLGDSPFGLADMAGNVWEWTQDVYSFSHEGAFQDGRAREGKNPLVEVTPSRVSRGGSWNGFASDLRSASRLEVDPGGRTGFLGFRPARGERATGESCAFPMDLEIGVLLEGSLQSAFNDHPPLECFPEEEEGGPGSPRWSGSPDHVLRFDLAGEPEAERDVRIDTTDTGYAVFFSLRREEDCGAESEDHGGLHEGRNSPQECFLGQEGFNGPLQTGAWYLVIEGDPFVPDDDRSRALLNYRVTVTIDLDLRP